MFLLRFIPFANDRGRSHLRMPLLQQTVPTIMRQRFSSLPVVGLRSACLKVNEFLRLHPQSRLYVTQLMNEARCLALAWSNKRRFMGHPRPHNFLEKRIHIKAAPGPGQVWTHKRPGFPMRVETASTDSVDVPFPPWKYDTKRKQHFCPQLKHLRECAYTRQFSSSSPGPYILFFSVSS